MFANFKKFIAKRLEIYENISWANEILYPCPNLDKSPFEMIMIRGSLRERENCVVSPKLHLAVVPQNEFSFVAPIS